MANLHENCLLKQAYNVELCYLHRNFDQWLKFVCDIMKSCDMEDYFYTPLNQVHHSLLIKSLRFWKIDSLNSAAEQYGQVFATLMFKVVVINSDYTGISKNRLSSRVI